ALSCNDVAKTHGTTPQTIARWVHALNENKNAGIEILKDKKKSGRKTRIANEELSKISDVLRTPPTKFGFDSNNWNGNILSNLLKQKFNIDLKVRQCQRLMQKLGYANQRGRPW